MDSQTSSADNIELDVLPLVGAYWLLSIAAVATFALYTTTNYFVEIAFADTTLNYLVSVGIFLGGASLGMLLVISLLPKIKTPLIWVAIGCGLVALKTVYFQDLFQFVRSLVQAQDGSLILSVLLMLPLLLPQSIIQGAVLVLLVVELIRCGDESISTKITYALIAFGLASVVGVLGVVFVAIPFAGLLGALYVTAALIAVTGLSAWIFYHRFDTSEPKQLTSQEAPIKVFNLFLPMAVGAVFFSLPFLSRMHILIVGATEKADAVFLAACLTGVLLAGIWRWQTDKKTEQASDQMQRFGIDTLLVIGITLSAILFVLDGLFGLYHIFRALMPLTLEGWVQFWVAAYIVGVILVFIPVMFVTLLLTKTANFANRSNGTNDGHYWQYTKIKKYPLALICLAAIVGAVLSSILLEILGLRFGLFCAAWVLFGVCLYILRNNYKNAGYVFVLASFFSIVGLFGMPSESKLATGLSNISTSTFGLEESLYYHTGNNNSAALMESSLGDILSIDGHKTGFLRLTDEDQPSRSTYANIFGAAVALFHHPQAQNAVVIGDPTITAAALLATNNSTTDVKAVILDAYADVMQHYPDWTQALIEKPNLSIVKTNPKLWLSTQSANEIDVIVSLHRSFWHNNQAQYVSKEYFAQVKRALASDGLFVQRINVGILRNENLALIINALNQEFDEYLTYLTDTNLFVVTSPDPSRLNILQTDLSEVSDLLKDYDITSADDVKALTFADKTRLQPFIDSYRQGENSDYFLQVQLEATKDMFFVRNNRLLKASEEFKYLFGSDLIVGKNYRVPFKQVTEARLSRQQSVLHSALQLLNKEVPISESLASLPVVVTSEEIEKFWDGDCENVDSLDMLQAMSLSMNVAISQLYPEELTQVWQRVNDELECIDNFKEHEDTAFMYAYYDYYLNGSQAEALEVVLEILPAQIEPTATLSNQLLVQAMGLAYQLEEYELALELTYRVSPLAPGELRLISRFVGSHAIEHAKLSL